MTYLTTIMIPATLMASGAMIPSSVPSPESRVPSPGISVPSPETRVPDQNFPPSSNFLNFLFQTSDFRPQSSDLRLRASEISPRPSFSLSLHPLISYSPESGDSRHGSLALASAAGMFSATKLDDIWEGVVRGWPFYAVNLVLGLAILYCVFKIVKIQVNKAKVRRYIIDSEPTNQPWISEVLAKSAIRVDAFKRGKKHNLYMAIDNERGYITTTAELFQEDQELVEFAWSEDGVGSMRSVAQEKSHQVKFWRNDRFYNLERMDSLEKEGPKDGDIFLFLIGGRPHSWAMQFRTIGSRDYFVPLKLNRELVEKALKEPQQKPKKTVNGVVPPPLPMTGSTPPRKLLGGTGVAAEPVRQARKGSQPMRVLSDHMKEQFEGWRKILEMGIAITDDKEEKQELECAIGHLRVAKAVNRSLDPEESRVVTHALVMTKLMLQHQETKHKPLPHAGTASTAITRQVYVGEGDVKLDGGKLPSKTLKQLHMERQARVGVQTVETADDDGIDPSERKTVPGFHLTPRLGAVAVEEDDEEMVDTVRIAPVSSYQTEIDLLRDGLESIKNGEKARAIGDALKFLEAANQEDRPLEAKEETAVAQAKSLIQYDALDRYDDLLQQIFSVLEYEEGLPKEFLKQMAKLLSTAIAEDKKLEGDELRKVRAAQHYIEHIKRLRSFELLVDTDVSDSKEALKRFLSERAYIANARLTAVEAWDEERYQAENRVEKLLKVNVADYEGRESLLRAEIKEYVVTKWWDYPELYDSLDAITPEFVQGAVQEFQEMHPEYQIKLTPAAIAQMKERKVQMQVQKVQDQLKEDLVDYDQMDPAVLMKLQEHVMILWEYPELGEGFEDIEEFTTDFIRHAAWDYQERHSRGKEVLLRPEIEDRVLEQRVEAYLRSEVDGYNRLKDRVKIALCEYVIDMWWDYEELRGESGTLDSDFVRRMADGYEYEGGRIRLKG